MEIGHSHVLERSGLEPTFVPASLQWAQLEPGRFDVQYAILDAAPLRVSARAFNVGFKGEAEVAAGKCVFGLPADPRTRARWFGATFDDESIGITRSTMHISSEGRGSFFGLVVDEAALQQLYPEAPDALALLENGRDAQLRSDPISARRLRALIHRAFTGAYGRCGSRVSERALKSIYGTLIPLLATAIERRNEHMVAPTKCLNRRLQAVRRCEDYMREHVDATLTLLDLSQVSGMRSRSLINAFEAVTGFSPMDYLKRLRLNGVHAALMRLDPVRTRIIDVATDWGFWHMGHFTNNYRAMFGETPSGTLLNRLKPAVNSLRKERAS